MRTSLEIGEFSEPCDSKVINELFQSYLLCKIIAYNNIMSDLLNFKNRIFLHCLALAIVVELISLPIIGWQWNFLVGILAGTVTTVVNFILLVAFAERMLAILEKKVVVGGYFIRMLIYGVVFVLSLQLGMYAAVGTAIGFFTLHLSIMIIFGIESNLPGAKKNPLNSWTEPKEWNDLSDWGDDDDDYSDF